MNVQVALCFSNAYLFIAYFAAQSRKNIFCLNIINVELHHRKVTEQDGTPTNRINLSCSFIPD